MSAIINGGAVVNGGGGGASLPDTPADVLLDAANPGKIVGLAQATGEGTSFDPNEVVEAGVGLAAGTTAGATLVGDGTEGAVLTSVTISALLASADAAAARAAIGVSGVSTFYASDFTAVNGSDTASISGTGSTSTIAFSTGTTARSYGTAGVTAPRAIIALPAGARVVEIELQVVSLSGASSGGFRYLTAAVQNVASGVPTALWGASFPDASATYGGNLLGGGNSGASVGSTIGVASAADRWARATLALTEPRFAVLHGSGSAGARPTTWTPVTSPQIPSSTSWGVIPDTANVTYLVIVYQSFGSGVANVITVRPAIRVTT